MEKQKKKKWTVFFLVKADGKDITNVILMINEIRNILITEDISVVFCIKILKSNMPALEEGDIKKISEEDQEPFITTAFYMVTPQSTPSKQPINNLELISENPLFDITDPFFLEDYFKQVILNRFKAKRYLIFTFDHGNAFGIFQGGATNSSGEEKVLTAEEINIAIRWALGKDKVDLIIMMNCYMQSIMTGFALHKSVKYFVAPESYMHFTGYNYSFLFYMLFSYPNISGKKLAEHAVSSFPKKVYTDFSQGSINSSNTALFATRLKHYKRLPKLIDDLVDFILGLNPFPCEQLKKARNMLPFGPADDLVDLFAFLENLIVTNFFKDYPGIANLNCLINDIIISHRFIGAKLNKSPNHPKYTGPSIYFPFPNTCSSTERLTDRPRFIQFLKSDFGKSTRWKDFLLKLFDNGDSKT